VRRFVAALVMLAAVSMLLSCAARRAKQAEMRAQLHRQSVQPAGSSCTSPPAGACPVCTIQCPLGQAAVCAPGKMADNACAEQASCKCGPPS